MENFSITWNAYNGCTIMPKKLGATKTHLYMMASCADKNKFSSNSKVKECTSKSNSYRCQKSSLIRSWAPIWFQQKLVGPATRWWYQVAWTSWIATIISCKKNNQTTSLISTMAAHNKFIIILVSRKSSKRAQDNMEITMTEASACLS